MIYLSWGSQNFFSLWTVIFFGFENIKTFLAIVCAQLPQSCPTLCMDFVAWQVPLSLGFFRQECWNKLPFPPSGDLPNPGIETASPVSPALRQIPYSLSHHYLINYCLPFYILPSSWDSSCTYFSPLNFLSGGLRHFLYFHLFCHALFCMFSSDLVLSSKFSILCTPNLLLNS